MTKRLVQFTLNDTRGKCYINPAHVAYLKENIGEKTQIIFAIGLDEENGSPHWLLVDGTIDETAAKLNAAKE